VNCKKAKNQISLLVDGYLDAKSQELLLQHIESCEDCRALYNDMQKTVSQLSDIKSVALPEGFENRMHFALKREATEKKKSRFLKYSVIAMPAAAAVVAVVLGVNFIVSGTSMKQALPERNMLAMDTEAAEMPKEEYAPEMEAKDGTVEKSMKPEGYGIKSDDMDEGFAGTSNFAKSFGIVVKSQVPKEKTDASIRNDIDTAKSIVLSLGIDENSIIISDDGRIMTVAIPVEQYQDFTVAVKDNNFIIDNEPANIEDIQTHNEQSYFEVTFLFQE
jgi:hypothetical protein